MEELFRVLCIQSAAALLLIQTGGGVKLAVNLNLFESISNSQLITMERCGLIP